MNKLFKKGPPNLQINTKCLPGDSDKYSAIERFFRRIAFNLGNSPSQTEVKIISCIPVDVTELQDRINTLAHELDRELANNEKLESQLKECNKCSIEYQGPLVVNFVKNRKRNYSKFSTDILKSTSTQSGIKSENWFHPQVTYSPRRGKSLKKHKVSNIISQTKIVATKPKNKKLRKKKSVDIIVSRSYEDYYRLGGKHAGRDLDTVCRHKPHHIRNKPYNRDVGVGLCLGGDINIARCCPESRNSTQTLSFYDDKLYDLIPVKESANKAGLQTTVYKNDKDHQINKTIKKSHPIQKVKKTSCNHFKSPSKESAFAKRCQRIYEEMEKRDKDTNTDSETMTSFFAASADLEAAEKENDAILLQIKDILQSLLSEVKTSQIASEDGNNNQKNNTQTDAVVQKDFEETMTPGYNISNQTNGWKFPALACAQLYPVLLQNSPIPQFLTGYPYLDAHTTNSTSAKKSFDKPKQSQPIPMSSETEKLIKEIYNTIALNGLLPKEVCSEIKKIPSVKRVHQDLRCEKRVLGQNQLRSKETPAQVNKTCCKDATSYSKPIREAALAQPNSSDIIVQRLKMPHEHREIIQERRKSHRNATTEQDQNYVNYADDIESVYSEFEAKPSQKYKHPRIPSILSNLFGKIVRKIRCVNHKLHNRTFHSQTAKSKTVQYLVPPKKNLYRPHCP